MTPELGKKKQFGCAADEPVSNIAGAANKSNHNLADTVSFFILDVCINEIYTLGNIGQD